MHLRWASYETVAVLSAIPYTVGRELGYALMTVMLAKTYAALKAAGVPDEQAQSAAEELGNAHEQFTELRTGLGQIHTDIAYMRGRFDVLIWAVGVNAAATIAILGVLLRH
jgi:hypothetical protein